MDAARLKATTIGHADHRFLSPLSMAKADALTDLLDPPAGARALDIACGKAGFLRRLLHRRAETTGVGVDINPAFVQAAAAAAVAEGVADRLTLVEGLAETFLAGSEARFDAVLCFGGSHAVGGLDGLAHVARAVLLAGGRLLVGEGFWRRPPEPEYLAVLGAAPGELSDHATNAERLRQDGFEILATAMASEDEWDEYEGFYCRAKTRWALSHDQDPDAAEILQTARRWHDAYLRWGRSTLGFGWYLAQLR